MILLLNTQKQLTDTKKLQIRT